VKFPSYLLLLRLAAIGLSLGSLGCRPASMVTSSTSGNNSAGPTGAAGARELAAPVDVEPSAFESPGPVTVPRFEEVASTAGIDFTYFNDEVPDRYFLPEVMGGGVAWIDFDGDRRLDLYLTNGAPLKNPDASQTEHVNRLYRNLGQGRFASVGTLAEVADGGFGQGCAVGDFDADGFADLYVTNYGRNLLLRNNGDGTFSDATEAAGVGDSRWGTSALWLDLNHDQQLDLYVVNYLNVSWENYQVCELGGIPCYCGPGQYEGEPDCVYLSQGDGTFVESAQALGMVGADGKGLAVAAVDFDGDLRPEIYVANDMAANYLFTRGDSREIGSPTSPEYRDVAVRAGCAVSDNGQNEASMGVACADFDGDGLVDIFLTHFHAQKNTLYRNLGSLLFQDDSRRTRIAATSYQTLGFGTVSFDYNLDGSLDLFVANGHVLGPRQSPHAMRPQLLANDGLGRFTDVSDQAGSYFDRPCLGRGAAGADFDNDGDLDLAVSHLDRRVALLRNDTPRTRSGSKDEAGFLGLSLETRNRIPPVGGRVVVRQGGRSWWRPIVAGGSYLSSGDSRLLLAVDAQPATADVEVHWPTGQVDRLEKLHINRYWRIQEGAAPWPE
jgi:hypothetical protein